MPIAMRYSINELFDACHYYFKETNRRMTFEYSLVAGVNDQPVHAQELASRLKKAMSCKSDPSQSDQRARFQAVHASVSDGI